VREDARSVLAEDDVNEASQQKKIEKVIVSVFNYVFVALSLMIDGAIILLAWNRLAVPLFHPALHLTYGAACGADVLRTVLLMGAPPRGSEKPDPKERFGDDTSRYLVMRIGVIVLVAVVSWIVT
jgi:hypothetical protein